MCGGGFIGDIFNSVGNAVSDVVEGVGDAASWVDDNVTPIAAKVASVVPGPWQIPAIAYNAGSALDKGNPLGAILSVVGGGMSLGAGDIAGATLVSEASFAAADAAQLAAQGLNSAAIAQNLVYSGVDSFIAADIAQLAAQGYNTATIVQNVAQSSSGMSSIFTNVTDKTQSLFSNPTLAKAASSVYKAVTTPNALGQTAIGSLANLSAGAYGSYAQSQLADKQAELAKWTVENSDPYREYRKTVEIPMMQSLLNEGATERAQADSLYNAAFSKATTVDPAVQTLQNQVLGTNALGGDYAAYEQRLQDSYRNPLGVYNSPEMQALNSVFMNDIQRRDSAAGRNSQYGSRAVEAQNNFLTNSLPTYRTGLNTAAQTAGGAQNTNYSNLNAALQGQQANQNNVSSNLGNLFNTQSTYAKGLTAMGMPTSATAGAGATAASGIMSGSNAMDSFSMNPLFKSLGLQTA